MPNIFVEINYEIFSIVILLRSSSDSRRDIVVYKRKRVHKVLPNLSLSRKSVVRLSDHLDMAMTIDWDFKPKTKESQNSTRGQPWLQIHQSTGAAVVEPLRCIGLTPHLVNQGSWVRSPASPVCQMRL